MHSTNANRFRLHVRGTLIEVEVEPKLLEPKARLLIDGETVDEQSTWPEQTSLQGPGMDVRIQWTWFARPHRAWAMFDDEQDERVGRDETGKPRPEHELAPPEGSWAARVTTFANDHPNLYASRHVVKATAQALIGLIGIGAILWGLLPRFDIAIPTPDINLGDWIRRLVPGWLQDLLNLPGQIIAWLFGWVADITVFDRFIDWLRSRDFPPEWLRTIVSNARYWVPILIAVLVAIEEVDRRSKKTRDAKETTNADAAQSPVEDGSGTPVSPHRDADSSPPDAPDIDGPAPDHTDAQNKTDTSP